MNTPVYTFTSDGKRSGKVWRYRRPVGTWAVLVVGLRRRATVVRFSWEPSAVAEGIIPSPATQTSLRQRILLSR